MTRDYNLYVEDIMEAIDKIESFVENIDFDEFARDDKTASAVVRKLEIIEEASKNIPDSIKQKYPKVPWREMARMRDKVIHHYFDTDYDIVWKVIKEELPELRSYVAKILKELDSNQQS